MSKIHSSPDRGEGRLLDKLRAQEMQNMKRAFDSVRFDEEDFDDSGFLVDGRSIRSSLGESAMDFGSSLLRRSGEAGSSLVGSADAAQTIRLPSPASRRSSVDGGTGRAIGVGRISSPSFLTRSTDAGPSSAASPKRSPVRSSLPPSGRVQSPLRTPMRSPAATKRAVTASPSPPRVSSYLSSPLRRSPAYAAPTAASSSRTRSVIVAPWNGPVAAGPSSQSKKISLVSPPSLPKEAEHEEVVEEEAGGASSGQAAWGDAGVRSSPSGRSLAWVVPLEGSSDAVDAAISSASSSHLLASFGPPRVLVPASAASESAAPGTAFADSDTSPPPSDVATNRVSGNHPSFHFVPHQKTSSGVEGSLRLELLSKERDHALVQNRLMEEMDRNRLLELEIERLSSVVEARSNYGDIAQRNLELEHTHSRREGLIDSLQLTVSHLNQRISELQRMEPYELKQRYEQQIQQIREDYEVKLAQWEGRWRAAQHAQEDKKFTKFRDSQAQTDLQFFGTLEVAHEEIRRLMLLNEKLEHRYGACLEDRNNIKALLEEEQLVRMELELRNSQRGQELERLHGNLNATVDMVKIEQQRHISQIQELQRQVGELLELQFSLEKKVRLRDENLESAAGELDTWKNAFTALSLSSLRKQNVQAARFLTEKRALLDKLREKFKSSMTVVVEKETAKLRKKVQLLEEERRKMKEKAAYYKRRCVTMCGGTGTEETSDSQGTTERVDFRKGPRSGLSSSVGIASRFTTTTHVSPSKRSSGPVSDEVDSVVSDFLRSVQATSQFSAADAGADMASNGTISIAITRPGTSISSTRPGVMGSRAQSSSSLGRHMDLLSDVDSELAEVLNDPALVHQWVRIRSSTDLSRSGLEKH